MFIYGLWDASTYKTKGIDYGYAPLPKNDNGTASQPLATVQGFVLNKFSDWPKESDAFLKYILRDEHQQELYEAGNGGNDRTGARNTCNKSVVASSYVQGSEILKSLASVKPDRGSIPDKCRGRGDLDIQHPRAELDFFQKCVCR